MAANDSTSASGELRAANDYVRLSVAGLGGVSFQVLGSFTGTITFEASVQGQAFQAFYVTPTNGTTAVTTATVAGLWTGSAVGFLVVQARMSSFTSGSAMVLIRSSAASPGGSGSGGGGGGGAVTITDGADVAEGSTTDAKVTGDNPGTVSAKLRGLDYLWSLVTDTANSWLKVSIQNTSIPVTPGAAASETLSNVAASATSVTALASNASRKGAIFFNDSTSAVYVKLGATASLTSFTYKAFAYQTIELPLPIYQGDVAAIWDSATGSLRVTEAA